jgi:hypothetical protein
VTGALNGRRYAALVFQAVARDPARQEFALFVDELEQEFRIFVIDMFDAEFAETAVFFAPEPDFRVAQKLYIFS